MSGPTLPPVFVEAVSFWSPQWPDWDAARPSFAAEDGARPAASPMPADAPAPRTARPAPALLPPAERRRAPDTVALALEVAAAAVAQSGRRAEELLSVFTSAHGDLGVTDYVCRTLAQAPTQLSPTKFHNSVHNAASGYWGIATGCLQASSAVTAFDCSFAAGLLEAIVQCAAEARPVLLVGYDIEATGALASTNDSRGLLGVALVLAPARGPRTQAVLQATLQPQALEAPVLRSAAARALASNAMADALPLFEALARASREPLALPLPGRLALSLRLEG